MTNEQKEPGAPATLGEIDEMVQWWRRLTTQPDVVERLHAEVALLNAVLAAKAPSASTVTVTLEVFPAPANPDEIARAVAASASARDFHFRYHG